MRTVHIAPLAQVRLARVIPSMHVHLCVALWLFSPRLSPSSTSFHRSPSSPSRCSPQCSTRSLGPTPCATSAWGPWPLLTTRHPSHFEGQEGMGRAGKSGMAGKEGKGGKEGGRTEGREEREKEKEGHGTTCEDMKGRDGREGRRGRAGKGKGTERDHRKPATAVGSEEKTRRGTGTTALTHPLVVAVRITVFCSAIVIDVIVHCHTAGALF